MKSHLKIVNSDFQLDLSGTHPKCHYGELTEVLIHVPFTFDPDVGRGVIPSLYQQYEGLESRKGKGAGK